MKNMLWVVLFIRSAFLNAQAREEFSAVLVEHTLLSIGEGYVFGNYELVFNNIESDSRCPKDVMCVRAGEAEVKVLIYDSGKLISEEKVIFTPASHLSMQKGNLFDSENLKISGVELFPYPKAGSPIQKEDYRLKIIAHEY